MMNGMSRLRNEFLSTIYQYTNVSSRQSYVSLSFLPMVYDAMMSKCLRTIPNLESESFMMNATKRAAFVMMGKLSKYKFTL